MAIWLHDETRILVQGMTGAQGREHTALMLASGATIVGGVTPGKGGTTVTIDDHELPVFDSVADAVDETGATASVVFVPPPHAEAAVMEAIDANLGLVVVITEGIPVQDSCRFVAAARAKGTRLIGPNCPGIISQGLSNAGIIPASITDQGPVGIVSKSGTLTYQLMAELSDIGISTAVGIGGDPVIGTTHISALQAFQDDPQTEAIILIGEIGGDAEERAAAYISAHITKPVVAYVAGFTAPEGRTMGHAGAIISGSRGTAQAKKEAFEAVGVPVGQTPSQTAQLLREALNKTAE